MAEEGARRTGLVTLLFTDLVASTELLDRLGDEEFERLRRIHFQLLREAVAASGGQEVKNLGDGLMVVFPSALDAIGCAVAMQQAVDLHNAEPDVAPIAVRVGLHAGEPIVEDDDYFGTPVVVAKRLCDRAAGGQILESDLVAALVGGRRQFSFRDVGAMELKGLGEPLATREVVWQGGADEQAFNLAPAPSASGAEAHEGRRRPPWVLAGAGASVAVLIGVAALALTAGDDATPAGGDDGTGLVAPGPSGTPRSFAQGRGDGSDGFFLVDNVILLREPQELPIDLREGEVVTIRAQAEQGAVAPFLELLGPSGSIVAFDVNAGGRGLPAIERWLVPETGRYVVRVSPLADVGRGEVEVIAFSIAAATGDDRQPEVAAAQAGLVEGVDSFATVVSLGEERPDAAWRWDTGELGQLKIRVQPHPDEPMIPDLQLSDGAGEVVELTQQQMTGDELIELPHGGEWTIEMSPGGRDPDGMVAMQVWIMGEERPQPEKIR
jgi:class 3 adenylate cyclase